MRTAAPRLSVCCLAGEPGARLAAVLEPLRPVADEIVVAADSRLGEDDLGLYASVADRLFRIDYRFAERHLAWLHAQCSGRWILRLDADEVVGSDLAAALPDLVERDDVEQFWVPRRWLFPDAGHWLDEVPWWPDFQCRLVRNDGLLRFPGVFHSSVVPVAPAEYLETPIYHLACIESDLDARGSKALRYEITHPGLQAAGGGGLSHVFYLPERYATGHPAGVPESDRALIESVLHPPPAVTRPERATVERVLLEETDRYWSGRELEPEAYEAAIEPFERDVWLAAGEVRAVHVRVTNGGTETWSWDPVHPPLIRLSYRWLQPGGEVLLPEGPRTSLPRALGPGESIVCPVTVMAPAVAGPLVLEVDLVHEHVRWFDRACRIRVLVTEPRSLTDRAPPSWQRRLARRLLPRRRRDEALIPRVIHRIWLGAEPMPADHEALGRTWAAHHPDWEMRLWTDGDLAALVPPDARGRARSPSEASDLLRYEVLRRHGGVYVDTDVESLKPLDGLIKGVSAFAAEELPGRIGTAIIGSVPGHPALERAAREARGTAGLGANSADSTGPRFLTLILADFEDVEIFPPRLFYPYTWHEPERRHEHFPDAYAVHHWAGSWREATGAAP